MKIGPLGFIVIFFVWWIIAANISDDRAPRTAETMGFTNVRVEDSTIWFTQFRGCGAADVKLWHVSGLNPQGKQSDFIICGGLFKGNTVRVE